MVIGPSAPSLQDVHPTSTTGDDELMAGAEIQANALDTVLRGLPLQPAPRGLDVLLIVLLGHGRAGGQPALLAAARPRDGARPSAAIFVVAVQLAFNGGTILPSCIRWARSCFSTVGALALHYVTDRFERERVRDLFARFVPENVVDDVLARADGAPARRRAARRHGHVQRPARLHVLRGGAARTR